MTHINQHPDPQLDLRPGSIYADEASKKKHEEMGFAPGWSKGLDQLVAHMKRLWLERQGVSA